MTGSYWSECGTNCYQLNQTMYGTPVSANDWKKMCEQGALLPGRKLEKSPQGEERRKREEGEKKRKK